MIILSLHQNNWRKYRKKALKLIKKTGNKKERQVFSAINEEDINSGSVKIEAVLWDGKIIALSIIFPRIQAWWTFIDPDYYFTSISYFVKSKQPIVTHWHQKVWFIPNWSS
ncbi:hypothetical protein ACFPU1_12405 [Thalassorhabdus alkalitolerans]|uniref:Uncharacterized protein n=1 Tax=Thalassorhabdus alkalitolerans TaxID=2282697 RepID=A0ABW0YPB0_9BACI